MTNVSGGARGECRGAETGAGQRVIAPVRREITSQTFFFHVGDFAIRGDFTIASGDATAPQRRETQKANETHHGSPPIARLSN